MAATVISYMPAIHQGYLEFLRKHPGQLFILGSLFIQEAPRMERDIRALEPSITAEMLRTLDARRDVAVINSKKDLIQLKFLTIVMPDEDLHRDFARQYLPNASVIFEPVFLRWDHMATTAKLKISPDHTISEESFDRKVMAQAISEGNKSPDWWRQIGAILLQGRQSILSSYNQHAFDTVNIFGDPRSNFDAGEGIELSKAIHAEASVIAKAARRGIALEGASLYVSTFPCPVCAKSIAVAGIKKVYYCQGYSLLDAEDILRSYGIELIFVKMKNPPSV